MIPDNGADRNDRRGTSQRTGFGAFAAAAVQVIPEWELAIVLRPGSFVGEREKIGNLIEQSVAHESKKRGLEVTSIKLQDFAGGAEEDDVAPCSCARSRRSTASGRRPRTP